MSYCKVRHCRFNNTHVTGGHKCGICGQYGHGQVECNNSKKHLEKYLQEKLPDYLQCKIANCKYKWSHTVAAHTCSHCGEREHDKNNCPKLTINLDCPICKTSNMITQEIIMNASQFKSDTECCICMSNKANVYFKECNHVCICTDCCRILKPFNSPNTTNFEDSYVSESDLPEEILDSSRGLLQNNSNVYCCIYGGMGCQWYIRKTNNTIQGFFMHSDSWGQYGPATDDRPKLDSFINGYTLVS